MKVCRIKEMKDLDRQAEERFGISREMLMENAGIAVFNVILQELGVAGRRFSVFCGMGNNGGDGFVVARNLHSNGAEVKVFLLGGRDKLQGSTKKNFEIVSRLGIEIFDVKLSEEVKDALVESDGVVDAILGTGLTREVGGVYKDVIELINDYGWAVFSVDIPSGVNGDNGVVMGVAVEADYTVTFGLPKIGNMLYPGYAYGGELFLSHISLPPSLHSSESLKVEIFRPVRLPWRALDSHKGDYGKTLFIAGSSNYLGAPYFSAMSFLKAGGGLSYLAAPKSISQFIVSKGSEIIAVPQLETTSGSIAKDCKGDLLKFSEKVDMVVLGPGISLNREIQELTRELVEGLGKPLIIDGDGITAVAENVEVVKNRKGLTVLTPHIGEMSRLTGKDIARLNKDKVGVLQQTAEELNAIIVLKGAHSLTGYPDGKVVINPSGNPGMATAGSGDVLTGTIAAMHGLGLTFEDAVPVGVFMHGLAGDLAVKDGGEDGITAQDVLDYLPSALKMYREEFDLVSGDFYGCLRVV